MVTNFPDSKERAPVTLIDWIQKNKSVYPFQGKYKDIRGTRLHYLDEGKGQPVFLPAWKPNLVIFLSQPCPVAFNKPQSDCAGSYWLWIVRQAPGT